MFASGAGRPSCGPFCFLGWLEFFAMLWCALHFPRLAVDALTRGVQTKFRANEASVQTPGAMAVVEGGRIWQVDAAAHRAGVRPGMSTGLAAALLPGLIERPRDRREEGELLARMAAWAGQFSAHVSLEEDALLLEVGTSLRLFGGLTSLMRRLRAGLRSLGFSSVIAAAPTPRAALWLAWAGRACAITTVEGLPSVLASLPLAVVPEARPHRDVLDGLGLVRLGDYWALPRKESARRFGPELAEALDRALGHAPDPRPRFCPPERFAGGIELPVPVGEVETLLFPLRRLFAEMEGFLRGRQAAVERMELLAIHEEGRVPTRIEIALARPGRDAQRFLELCRHRLEALTLPAPVVALRLCADRLVAHRPRSLPLFPGTEGEEENASRLVERLRARLGAPAVYGLACLADHRPERAQVATEPGTTGQPPPVLSRPVWVLPFPRPLPSRNGQPCLGAPLALTAGPERIETGWWDGEPCARDYFVAQAPGGGRYWVYRQPDGAWFLHGLFA